MQQPPQRSEVFRFGAFRFDIDWVREHIAAGSVRSTVGTLNIVEWAEKILSLDRARPEHQPCSFLMRINYDHLMSIDSDRLRDPVFLVETDMGLLVIDGNHRVAKAYMSGIDELPSIRFNKSEAKKLLKPPKRLRLKAEA
jgi:hypothetical protein